MKLLVFFLLGVITSAVSQSTTVFNVTEGDYFKFKNSVFLKGFRCLTSGSITYSIRLPNGTFARLMLDLLVVVTSGALHRRISRPRDLIQLHTDARDMIRIQPREKLKTLGKNNIPYSDIYGFLHGAIFLQLYVPEENGYKLNYRSSLGVTSTRPQLSHPRALILAILVAVRLYASYRQRDRRGDLTQLKKDAGDKEFLVNQRDTTQAVPQHDTQDGHKWVKQGSVFLVVTGHVDKQQRFEEP
ncbi:hypothetical protein O3P69_014006 [Scylla paramamosain]|uniref:Uncharacterized protein n=1 Tax=Scylla paramamosain TaxID=85552 RepID=A0AAW0SRL4_SCYPA